MGGSMFGYVSSRPCGCVEYVSVDDHDAAPRDREAMFRHLAADSARGLYVVRLPLDDVCAAARRMGTCDKCEVAP